MIRPNTRNIVVTKSKYGPAAKSATSTSSVNADQERQGVRQDEVGDGDAEREEHQREWDPRADRLALAGVRPGETNAQIW